MPGMRRRGRQASWVQRVSSSRHLPSCRQQRRVQCATAVHFLLTCSLARPACHARVALLVAGVPGISISGRGSPARSHDSGPPSLLLLCISIYKGASDRPPPAARRLPAPPAIPVRQFRLRSFRRLPSTTDCAARTQPPQDPKQMSPQSPSQRELPSPAASLHANPRQ